MSSALGMRTGQKRFMRLTDQYRVMALVARRQWGKTTIFSKIAMKKMAKKRDHTVIFGSAKLTLSREIVRKEAQIIQAAIDELIAQAAQDSLQVVDAGTGKRPDVLTADDFAELFEAQRLEFRLYHTRTSYSRTKVVALREDAVGDTGDLMCDELRAIKNWREVWEAVSPIIASSPDFRCTLSTTVPTSDNHYAFEQLMPPAGTVFTPNKDGTLYESEHGIMVLRVDADDAYLDGVPLYDDKTGKPQTPAESRAKARDKDAWDRNYGCKFLVGGTAAVSLLSLASAQERGLNRCLHIHIDDDADLARACDHIQKTLGTGPVGLGWDLATTEKGSSNPSAFAVMEQASVHDYVVRLVVTWKTKDEEIAKGRAKLLVQAVERRQAGGRAKALHIDSTNERLFSSHIRRSFRALLPVTCVVGSESVKKAGFDPMTTKQYLGSILVAELDENHLSLPPEPYIKDDFRLVYMNRGQFQCDPDSQGRHGDTFDAVKLALNALRGAPPPPPPKSFTQSRRNLAIAARRDRRVFC